MAIVPLYKNIVTSLIWRTEELLWDAMHPTWSRALFSSANQVFSKVVSDSESDGVALEESSLYDKIW